MEKQPTLKDKVQKFYKNPCYDTFNKLDRNLIAYRLVLERNIKEFFRLEDWILTYLNIHEFKVTAKIEIRKMVQWEIYGFQTLYKRMESVGKTAPNDIFWADLKTQIIQGVYFHKAYNSQTQKLEILEWLYNKPELKEDQQKNVYQKIKALIDEWNLLCKILNNSICRVVFL